MNTFTFIGRITKDPEIVQRGQIGVCEVAVAIDRPKKKDGTSATDFPVITAFGKTAENLKKYTKKGSLIAVTGKVQTGSYEKEGKKIYTTSFIADSIEYLEKRQEANQNASQTQGGYSSSDDEDIW